jgi:hypothetical protein
MTVVHFAPHQESVRRPPLRRVDDQLADFFALALSRAQSLPSSKRALLVQAAFDEINVSQAQGPHLNGARLVAFGRRACSAPGRSCCG